MRKKSLFTIWVSSLLVMVAAVVFSLKCAERDPQEVLREAVGGDRFDEFILTVQETEYDELNDPFEARELFPFLDHEGIVNVEIFINREWSLLAGARDAQEATFFVFPLSNRVWYRIKFMDGGIRKGFGLRGRRDLGDGRRLEWVVK